MRTKQAGEPALMVTASDRSTCCPDASSIATFTVKAEERLAMDSVSVELLVEKIVEPSGRVSRVVFRYHFTRYGGVTGIGRLTDATRPY